ncbi:ABC transporter ATP-binding protein [Streptomyces odontomachi]|uniref:ABC transporter ATP-binding protein n=1 Tax=Streptomyces odontomachi TaxID=2944940 RepID=UPI00210B792A|nr:ABC transporter ATP-binding protein [Streptomyces sp. ODS25]
MATVELEKVRKTYGKTLALDELSLHLADGEFFVLLGPSGAGKTTTLKSVAGLQEVDAGRILIGGTDMTQVEPYERNVAMAFESYALYPQKTVFDNLASPLRSGRTGRYTARQQSERIEAVTTTLGIDTLLKRFPRELSNGQRQRVALGRVLVRPADVYLLDEPLSHLDAKLRAAMRAELKSLGELSSTTTFYVTHDYQEALALGDRIGILRAGTLVQVGTPQQVWSQPVDTFAAKALGQPEINLLDGEVVDGRIVAAGGSVTVPAPEPGLPPGTPVRLGLRPRDLELTGADPTGPRKTPEAADTLVVPGKVRLAERLGRLVELSVDIDGAELIVVSSSDRAPAEGDTVRLAVPLDLVHVFAGGERGEETARLGSAAPPRTDTDRPQPAQETR